MAAKRSDEGCSSWASPYSVQHPSSVSALRADPPSPARGEGKARSGPTRRVRNPLISPHESIRQAQDRPFGLSA
ncbi:MAG: hypothetical protein EOR01_18535 [Mesorhizobium sp.]|nr:MAG: hypothetical protein EOR00_17560 [Mesorhizobium sp.]RWP20485.1 MAG: hypothetical protein EOR01_18535 [Mesorhizobium sp.]RWQ58806.1 MAG: hypothetical protein EOS83_12415 [Mesorhizobium sp.]